MLFGVKNTYNQILAFLFTVQQGLEKLFVPESLNFLLWTYEVKITFLQNCENSIQSNQLMKFKAPGMFYKCNVVIPSSLTLKALCVYICVGVRMLRGGEHKQFENNPGCC